MLISFTILLFGIIYLAGTPGVQTLKELSEMDIIVIIAAVLSFLKLMHSFRKI